MKCHLCVNYIEMQTDPANCDYVIVSGAQRKEERWDPQDNEQVLATGECPVLVYTTTQLLLLPPAKPVHPRVPWLFPPEHEEKKKLETDAMYRLEHGAADQGKLQRALPTLSNIQEAQSAWKDDFALNSMLRRKFRVRAGFRGWVWNSWPQNPALCAWWEDASATPMCPLLPPTSARALSFPCLYPCPLPPPPTPNSFTRALDPSLCAPCSPSPALPGTLNPSTMPLLPPAPLPGLTRAPSSLPAPSASPPGPLITQALYLLLPPPALPGPLNPSPHPCPLSSSWN